MSGSRPLGRDPAGAPGSPGAAGLHPLVPILLRLYPRGWRARYESEFLTLLADGALTPSTFPDIVLAALDARLSGEYPITESDGRKARFRMPDRASPLALIAGGTLITLTLLFALAAGDQSWEMPLGLLLLGFPVGFALTAAGIAGIVLADRSADRILRGLGSLSAVLAAAVAAAMVAMIALGDAWWYAWSIAYLAFIFASGAFGLRLATDDRSRLLPGLLLAAGLVIGLLGVASMVGLVPSPGAELLLALPLVGWIALGIAELMRDRMVPAG